MVVWRFNSGGVEWWCGDSIVVVWRFNSGGVEVQ